MEIKIADYSYFLPEEKIAKHPVEPRDSSRLLVSESGKITHHKFSDISKLLPVNSHLVFNNTRVIPARLFFKRKTGAVIEVFLLHPVSPSPLVAISMESRKTCEWECVIGNKKKWKTEEILTVEITQNGHPYNLSAKLIDKDANLVRFEWDSEVVFSEIIGYFGNIPLPPYLNRDAEEDDIEDYQTVYSKEKGAVAAPTAGLHFSELVLENIAKKGIRQSYLTLHVGAGTFQPVKTENALEHPMHEEQMVFSRDFISDLLYNHEFVIPVGTTSMRSLESLYWFGVKLLNDKNAIFFIEKLFPYQNHQNIPLNDALKAILAFMESGNLTQLMGSTEIMIFPGYKFKVCKALITNFHQPGSTLLLLVAALVGENYWKYLYNEALENNYRFLSFGDSSLLIP
jgi:S-adenosylmethionine:tRNA ribosyltransferase-isomerase